MNRALCWILLAFLTLIFAAGCGKEEGTKPATQVVAKVNADEITVHQVDGALARAQKVPPEAVENVKREVLDRLIDQSLAKQQAVHKKLDRLPAVLQALEGARSEILARAYIEQVAAAQPKPTAEEIKRYYAEHPELFAQRRIFSLEELAFAANEDIAAELRQRTSKSRSLKEVAEWLQSRGVKFVPNRGVRAAEQIPLELLAKLHGTKDGEMLLIEAGNSRQVIRVVASKLEPVDEATASARIQQFLSNRRASEAIATEMKQLKGGAKIEYLGEFADGAAKGEARAKAAAKAQAEAEAQAKAKANAEAQARAEEATKARIASETKARLEAEAQSRAAASKAAALPEEAVKKGVSGIK